MHVLDPYFTICLDRSYVLEHYSSHYSNGSMAPRQYLGVYFSEANPFKSHNLPEDYLTNFPDIHPGLQSFSKHIKY